ncbi:MAG TPA: hypothetical protein VG318_00670 [Actinomycetota bacterium]|nr:hypothetical protein [Actinomycetota bacterium]
MRKRVVLLAASLGAASIIGLAPQAQASCTQLWFGGPCIENVVCRVVSVLPGPQYCVA